MITLNKEFQNSVYSFLYVHKFVLCPQGDQEMGMEDKDWKKKVMNVISQCGDELKRTTEIGKKMLNASKTNSSLHEAYEEIGKKAVIAMRKGELQWEDSTVEEILGHIEICEEELAKMEGDVNRIRFSEDGQEPTIERSDPDPDEEDLPDPPEKGS